MRTFTTFYDRRATLRRRQLAAEQAQHRLDRHQAQATMHARLV